VGSFPATTESEPAGGPTRSWGAERRGWAVWHSEERRRASSATPSLKAQEDRRHAGLLDPRGWAAGDASGDGHKQRRAIYSESEEREFPRFRRWAAAEDQ